MAMGVEVTDGTGALAGGGAETAGMELERADGAGEVTCGAAMVAGMRARRSRLRADVIVVYILRFLGSTNSIEQVVAFGYCEKLFGRFCSGDGFC